MIVHLALIFSHLLLKWILKWSHVKIYTFWFDISAFLWKMQISIQMLIRQKAYWLCWNDDYFHVNICICQVNSIQSNIKPKKKEWMPRSCYTTTEPGNCKKVFCECINFIRRVVKKEDPSWYSTRMIGFSLLLCREHGKSTQGLLASSLAVENCHCHIKCYITCVNTHQTRTTQTRNE